MLIGEYKTKITEKKRISLPKKFRDEIGDDLILTRGYENALILVNKKLWENIAKDVLKGSFTSKDIRDTSRFLVGGAKEIQLDTQGRFVVPESLLEHAGLKSDVIFLGLINWIEIWDLQQWQKRLDYLKKHGEEIAEEINKMNSTNTNE